MYNSMGRVQKPWILSWVIETGGSEVQGHQLLSDKFEPSLVYMCPSLKNKLNHWHVFIYILNEVMTLPF